MYKTALFFALSAFAVAGPIYVTGGGSFEYDLTIGGAAIFNIDFSGSADGGTRSVSIHAVCNGIAPNCQGSTQSPGFGSSIDGMIFQAGFFTFSLGEGNATGYNAQHQPIITEAISGYLTQTSTTCLNNNPETCQGLFNVGTPEPRTFALAGIGLVILVLSKARLSFRKVS